MGAPCSSQIKTKLTGFFCFASSACSINERKISETEAARRASAPEPAWVPRPLRRPRPRPRRAGASQDTIVTSLVLATEAAKVICAIILLIADGSLKKQFSNWTLIGSLTASGLPAAIYALQNSLLQKQSSKQILALALLISAAVLLSVGESTSKGSNGGGSDYILLYGIIPVTVASMLSGLASSLCQWASQVKKHTSYMMTIEMSFIGSVCLLASTYRSPDGEAIRKYGVFHEWTFWTMVPVLMNAVGGILVGLVTTYAGFCYSLSSPCNCTATIRV
uniref:CMP-sialic acid transporter 5 n=1 Tax=Zea mays TaxID=4577 RepID=A0A804NSH4_MAIZE